ncbi:MAG: hypothetical protein P1S60_19655, partial [Anaerolineae bacterium]|nr:hypothetical protein [Anaerolineae bacterium]
LDRLRAAAKTPTTIEEQIQAAQSQLENVKARVPKHDIPVAIMMEMDELEEEIERLKNLRDAES